MKQGTTGTAGTEGMAVRRRGAGVLALALALLAAVAAAGQDVSVRVGVEPRLVELGETATLSIVFEGAREVPDIALPGIDGAAVGGPMRSSSTQIVNGNVSQQVSLQWTLAPTRTGDIVIGPWDLDVGGKKLAFPRLVLAVKERADGIGSDGNALFARVVLPEKAPFLHQDFPVTIEVWAANGINLDANVRLRGGLPESGFKSDGFAGLRATREEHEGRVYTVQRYRAVFRALTAGEFEFAPVVEATVLQRERGGRRRDFFSDPFADSFFGFGMTGTPVELPAPAAVLAVRPVPEEGRPADWSGAVGRFRFEAEAKPREVAVGEPVTVTLTVAGEGNLESAKVPSYGDTAAYKTYEPKRSDGGASAGVKTFDQVVIPQSDALMELPALEFSYFDPDAEAYRTLRAGPFPLDVKPAAGGGRALVVAPGAVAAGRGGAAPTILGSDIQYLHEIGPRARRGGGGAAAGAAWWAVHGLALAGLGAWWWVLKRRSRLASDVAFARRLKAPRVSRAHLRRAQELLGRGAGAEEVFAELSGAVTAYFGHRYNLPPGDATAGFITARLEEAGLDAESVAGFSEFFEVADRVRYASSALGGEDLGAWPGRVAALLRQAERAVR